MAKASKQVQRKVTEETTITLTLSVDEAVTLSLALASVAGSRENSPRKHTQAVAEALSKAGVDYARSTAYGLQSGHIRFDPYPDGFTGETLHPEGISSFLGLGRPF